MPSLAPYFRAISRGCSVRPDQTGLIMPPAVGCNPAIFSILWPSLCQHPLESRSCSHGLKRDQSCITKIWRSGPDHINILLRCQLDFDDHDRLIYDGKPYSRDTCGCYYVGDCELYAPPKAIRQMGRIAKESPNPCNVNPEIQIRTLNGDVLTLDACPCGGDLRMDQRGILYCSSCHLIYE